MLSNKQKAKYVDECGSQCPYCGSDDIGGSGFNCEVGLVWQRVDCLNCGRDWTDVYRLDHISEDCEHS